MASWRKMTGLAIPATYQKVLASDCRARFELNEVELESVGQRLLLKGYDPQLRGEPLHLQQRHEHDQIQPVPRRPHWEGTRTRSRCAHGGRPPVLGGPTARISTATRKYVGCRHLGLILVGPFKNARVPDFLCTNREERLQRRKCPSQDGFIRSRAV